MDNVIAVVGCDGIIEGQRSDATPILVMSPRNAQDFPFSAFIGHFDEKNELALGLGIARIENLPQNLIAEIEIVALDPWLLPRDNQAHEFRRPCGFVPRLAQFGDLIDLALAVLLIDEDKDDSLDYYDRHAFAAPPRRDVWRVEKLRVVDVTRVVAANVFLGEKLAGWSGWA